MGVKELLEANYDVRVLPMQDVDFSQPCTLALYIDYNWRDLFREKRLKSIPFEKRALLLVEPSSINPSAYVVPWLRHRFHTVITWDKRLVATDRRCHPIVVNPWAEPPDYRDNQFAAIPFEEKKLLVAIAGRRVNFMPWSNYARRNKVYHYFDRELPNDFDLFGNWWRDTDFKNVYRGTIPMTTHDKMERMARYRFALCYENNSHQSGYVSEKISDCICARCVPIYHGSAGIEERVPRDCFIDAEQFKSLAEMKEFIVSMTEAEHRQYIKAMDAFCSSDLARSFTRKHFADCLAKALGLIPRPVCRDLYDSTDRVRAEES